MANVKPVFQDTTTGWSKQFSDSDTALLGGIDRSAAGSLSIGTTNSTAISIGKTGITTTVEGDLTVQGTQTYVGGTTFQGNTTFGDAATDTVEFVARMATSTHLLPIADSSSNLGSDSLRFLGGFIDKVTTEEIEDTVGTLVIDSINASAPSTITIENSDATYTTEVSILGDLDVSETLDITGATNCKGGLLVDTGGTLDVDVISDFSANVDISGTAILTVAATATFNGDTNIGSDSADDVIVNASLASDIIPKTDGTYDLGNTTFRFAEIWCDDLTVTSGITATQANRVENDYVAATGGIADRDVVYKNATNNEVGKAQANSATTSKVVGIAMEAISAASSGAIASKGVITSVGSGWTAGAPIYLSTSVAGGTQTTFPTGSGNIVLPLGFAKNATDLDYQLQTPTILS